MLISNQFLGSLDLTSNSYLRLSDFVKKKSMLVIYTSGNLIKTIAIELSLNQKLVILTELVNQNQRKMSSLHKCKRDNSNLCARYDDKYLLCL